jgi:biopolymer transport protein ExbB
MLDHASRQKESLYWLLGLTVLLAALFASYQSVVWAQDAGEDEAGPSPAPIEAPADGMGEVEAAEPVPEGPAQEKIEGIPVLQLIVRGGWFMLPIILMSLLVVTFVIERFMALRRIRVLPDELIEELGQLGGGQGGFDPRPAYRLCQRYPSSAATVIRSMLLKVGRPHSEVEHAVAEASEREAERIYSNVRWLNLAAAVTPLMGLLGTVWGMIRAFHDTTQLAPGQNKADFLAEGIYVALVTTLGGLTVAIPAAIFSHYFEGRITTLFHEIDELLFSLMPQVERYEGRVRFSQKIVEDRTSETAASGQEQQQTAATVTN